MFAEEMPLLLQMYDVVDAFPKSRSLHTAKRPSLAATEKSLSRKGKEAKNRNVQHSGSNLHLIV